jgi:hypothetical protein
VVLPTAKPATFYHSATPKPKSYVHVTDISPFPKCASVEKRKRKAQRAEILTSSPYKRCLLEKLDEKKTKEKKTTKPKSSAKKPGENVTKKQGTRKEKRNKVKTTKGKHNHQEHQNLELESEEGDFTPCGTCGVTFESDRVAKNGRKWTQCQSCRNWYHNDCQGLDSDDVIEFDCISCESSQ